MRLVYEKIVYDIEISPNYISIKRPLGGLKLYSQTGDCYGEVTPDPYDGYVEISITDEKKSVMLWIRGVGFELSGKVVEKLTEVFEEELRTLKDVYYKKKPYTDILNTIIEALKQ